MAILESRESTATTTTTISGNVDPALSTAATIDMNGDANISSGSGDAPCGAVERVRHWCDAMRVPRIPEIADDATFDYIIASDVLYFASQVKSRTHEYNYVP